MYICKFGTRLFNYIPRNSPCTYLKIHLAMKEGDFEAFWLSSFFFSSFFSFPFFPFLFFSKNSKCITDSLSTLKVTLPIYFKVKGPVAVQGELPPCFPEVKPWPRRSLPHDSSQTDNLSYRIAPSRAPHMSTRTAFASDPDFPLNSLIDWWDPHRSRVWRSRDCCVFGHFRVGVLRIRER